MYVGKKFELTEEQKQEIREAFDLFDTDGSGTIYISADEVISIIEYFRNYWRQRVEGCYEVSAMRILWRDAWWKIRCTEL